MGIITRMTVLAAVSLLVGAGAALFSAAGLLGGPGEDPASTAAPPISQTDRLVANLQERLKARPEDSRAYVQLGFAYLQKARESGDPAYYTRADGVFQRALELRPEDPSAITGLSAVASARHDFSQALELAQQAPQDDPDTYGALGDALVELGRYQEAFEAFQRMADLRPGLSSYTRISYARELTGDGDGAIEAMEQAIDAAGPRGEAAAWTRLQMGHLYFNRGEMEAAQAEYEQSLRAFPGYVHALAGLARVHAARDEYGKAADLYEQVVTRQPVLEYVVALGDVYSAGGREADAARQYELVEAIARLYQANGVNTDQELALFFADHDWRLDGAVRQAHAAYEQRPSIHAADALAWALYKSGRYEEAQTYSQEALRLGTRDPLLLFHAGMIRYRLGDYGPARRFLEQALRTNPRFSVLYAGEAAETLEQLQSLVGR